MKKSYLFTLVFATVFIFSACTQKVEEVAQTEQTTQIETTVEETTTEEETIDEFREKLDKSLEQAMEEMAGADDAYSEMVKSRLIYPGKYYPGTRIAIPDSVAMGMVERTDLEKALGSGSYAYSFGTGEMAYDENAYLSGVTIWKNYLEAEGYSIELKGGDENSLIKKGSAVAAEFRVFNTRDEGYLLLLTIK